MSTEQQLATVSRWMNIKSEYYPYHYVPYEFRDAAIELRAAAIRAAGLEKAFEYIAQSPHSDHDAIAELFLSKLDRGYLRHLPHLGDDMKRRLADHAHDEDSFIEVFKAMTPAEQESWFTGDPKPDGFKLLYIAQQMPEYLERVQGMVRSNPGEYVRLSELKLVGLMPEQERDRYYESIIAKFGEWLAHTRGWKQRVVRQLPSYTDLRQLGEFLETVPEGIDIEPLKKQMNALLRLAFLREEDYHPSLGGCDVPYISKEATRVFELVLKRMTPAERGLLNGFEPSRPEAGDE